MVFNSLDFLLFLPAVFILYFILPHKVRNPFLLLASYYFYFVNAPVLIVFLLAITLVAYGIALLIQRSLDAGHPKNAKGWMIAGVVLNLGTLAFYKYINFMSETIASLLHTEMRSFDFIVPLGISFIIFQTVSYIIDVYRQTIHAERNLMKFALYVAFFPKVTQGPIEKAGNILPQFDEKHEFDLIRFREGMIMVIFGLFMKMAVADNAAIIVNKIYGDLKSYSGAAVIFATVMFSLQIYFDFAGYSLMAIGSARVMGFDFKRNFRQPYLSKSPAEFWKRWHMSLNVWLRDYLYIPLGGSRCSNSRRNFNTLVTFGLSGLWHGADWGYVIWGLLNGVYVAVEGSFKKAKKNRAAKCVEGDHLPTRCERKEASDSKVANFFKCTVNFILITIAWTFFRAQKLSVAVAAACRVVFHLDLGGFFEYVGDQISAGAGTTLYGLDVAWRLPELFGFIIIIWIVDLLMQKRDLVTELSHGHRAIRWTVCILLILLIVIFGVYGYGYSASAFVYGAF